MEARDLGNTITLYLPQPSGGPEPYAVFQDRQRIGGFRTQAEAMQFALQQADMIRRTREVPIRVRREDEAGCWHTDN
ncbi:hypothetical protein BJI69_19675 [Luteibacter rhizovicinus DSM 16549]|uniref:Uncharacterized protein n=1 Tax=Luteibacter rhizovicinus DSM 16549 TaxID=1440763 RepID=A0A0G9HHM9_9GAMM|nr:hypothetical protein [Luteibacter rhizovicinus]APG05905.1 hypothetical protein BJI69_19675 [Luteibacter rhizovicinus DSM 16549]KLD67147.1 hypothetical protein Y883_09325 [Luteibacter rhizovicinus DSM 16549]